MMEEFEHLMIELLSQIHEQTKNFEETPTEEEGYKLVILFQRKRELIERFSSLVTWVDKTLEIEVKISSMATQYRHLQSLVQKASDNYWGIQSDENLLLLEMLSGYRNCLREKILSAISELNTHQEDLSWIPQ